MAESFNLVLHIIAGLAFIGMMFWVVKLQKRLKLQKLLMKTILEPQSNIKFSGNFRNLLSRMCDILGIHFECDVNASNACVLSLGDWVHEIASSHLKLCEFRKQNEKLVLLFTGPKKLSVEKLQNAVKFMNRTELQIKFVEENKK